MCVAVTVEVNMSRRTHATPQASSSSAQVNELAHQMDRLSTRKGGQHPYANTCQCNKCGCTGHLASKCGVKCTACGRWGHLADVCQSKRSMETPSASQGTANHDSRLAQSSSRSRPYCDFCKRQGHTRDHCCRNPDGSNNRLRNNGQQQHRN